MRKSFVFFLHPSWEADINDLLARPAETLNEGELQGLLRSAELFYPSEVGRVDDGFRIVNGPRPGVFASYPSATMRLLSGA